MLTLLDKFERLLEMRSSRFLHLFECVENQLYDSKVHVQMTKLDGHSYVTSAYFRLRHPVIGFTSHLILENEGFNCLSDSIKHIRRTLNDDGDPRVYIDELANCILYRPDIASRATIDSYALLKEVLDLISEKWNRMYTYLSSGRAQFYNSKGRKTHDLTFPTCTLEEIYNKYTIDESEGKRTRSGQEADKKMCDAIISTFNMNRV